MWPKISIISDDNCRMAVPDNSSRNVSLLADKAYFGRAAPTSTQGAVQKYNNISVMMRKNSSIHVV